MNNIQLKENNFPTKTGNYLRKNKFNHISFATITDAGSPKGLLLSYSGFVIYLHEDEKDTLWSDEITFN